MSTQVRQLIFGLVVFGFIVGVAWLLLYSSGYHFNVTELAFQPTGGIRLSIHPSRDDLTIMLQPNQHTSSSPDTIFTHLPPTTYQLTVNAPQYQTVSFLVDVKPNVTTMLEPLYLWPVQVPFQVNATPTKPTPLETTELPIVFQSILASTITPEQNDYVLVTQRQFIVLNQETHTVTEYTRDGSVITSQQLGSDVNAMMLSQNKLLLISSFGLTVVDVTAHTTETITRISTPITAASWINNTPYITYTTENVVHMIDTRPQTNYLDQAVTTTPQPISDAWYDADLNSVWLIAADTYYRWPLELAI